jgi:hypothetical protein
MRSSASTPTAGHPRGDGFTSTTRPAAQRRASRSRHTIRGSDGLYGRADLAGLNLAQYRSILIEMGNAEEAAVPSVSA